MVLLVRVWYASGTLLVRMTAFMVRVAAWGTHGTCLARFWCVSGTHDCLYGTHVVRMVRVWYACGTRLVRMAALLYASGTHLMVRVWYAWYVSGTRQVRVWDA